MIEGEIIAPQHWQLTSSRIKEVRDFKKKHKLGIAIRVETNQNCDWNYLSLVLQFLQHSSTTPVRPFANIILLPISYSSLLILPANQSSVS